MSLRLFCSIYKKCIEMPGNKRLKYFKGHCKYLSLKFSNLIFSILKTRSLHLLKLKIQVKRKT